MSYVYKDGLMRRLFKVSEYMNDNCPEANDGNVAAYDKGYTDGLKYAFAEIQNIIDSMPEFTPNWISTKAQMPKPYQDVLLSDGENVEYGYYDEKRKCWEADAPHCYGEILYWCDTPDTSDIYFDTYDIYYNTYMKKINS